MKHLSIALLFIILAAINVPGMINGNPVSLIAAGIIISCGIFTVAATE